MKVTLVYETAGIFYPRFLSTIFIGFPSEQLYHICSMLDQRRRRWADVVQMLCKCCVFTGIHAQYFLVYLCELTINPLTTAGAAYI